MESRNKTTWEKFWIKVLQNVLLSMKVTLTYIENEFSLILPNLGWQLGHDIRGKLWKFYESSIENLFTKTPSAKLFIWPFYTLQ